MRPLLLFPLLLGLLAARPAAAQLTDSFTDNDFTQNPAWSGDVADFQVNPSQQLQSNGPAVTTTVRSLATPSRVSGAATWEFWANLRFATSSGNLADVFLMSDSLNLQAPNHGYFVRLGGTPDEVSLFRKDGAATPVYVVDGADGLLSSSSNNLVRVRVTRSPTGSWTLEADPTGGTTYQLQGTARDTVYATSRWFGVLIRYSAANNQRFLFDDFSITDNTPPVIRAVTLTSPTTLRVRFDEPVAAAPAATPANYSVSGSGAPAAAVVDPQDDAAVLLTFSSPFAAGVQTLTVTFAEDLYGNATATPLTATFNVTVPPQPPLPGDVRINELYIDTNPLVGLPAAGFVEVLNVSTRTFDLAGWRLRDATSSTGTLAAGRLAPNQYAILCRATDTTTWRTFLGPSVRIVGITSMPTLNVTGDQVHLLAPDGTLLDRVAYTDDWYRDPAKAQGGWSLEQINPTRLCSDADNWIASQDPSGGTPGRQNSVFSSTPDLTAPTILSAVIRTPTRVDLTFSEAIDTLTASLSAFSVSMGLSVANVRFRPDTLRLVTLTLSGPLVPGTSYTLTVTGVRDCAGNAPPQPIVIPLVVGAAPSPGEVRINELYVDTNPVVGLPALPFVEVLNVSNKVFDVFAWQLQDATSTVGTLGPGLLSPGQYAILCRATDTTAFRTALGAGVRIVGITGMPTLNATGDLVQLRAPDGTLLDRVTYTDDWYRDPAKAQGGWSLEQINPTRLCSDADNWIASQDPSGGTPGRQNSVFSNAPDTAPPTVVSAVVISPTRIDVTFSEAIDTLTAPPAAFTLDQGLSVTDVQFRPDTLRVVSLTLSAPLQPGSRYTLTVSGVRDCAGNVSAMPFTVALGLGDLPGLYEVLITEIMADETPQVGLPAAEYLEIYNATTRVLTLDGVRLRKQGSASAATFPAGSTLNPGQHAVVCGSTRGSLFAPYGKVFALPSFPSLNNGGDTLVLRRPDGQLLFSVAYSDAWYRDEAKQDGGWSLEMIDVARPCGGAENWNASQNAADGGTPGRVNSVAASVPDQQPPVLNGVSVLSPTTLLAQLSEKLDSVRASDPGRYSLGASGPAITSVQVRGPEFRDVVVLLASPLPVGQPRTLTITGLTDCVGNQSSQPTSAPVLVPETPRRADVVINEVLFNPRTGGVDFVEIANRSTRQLDLRGWLIANVRDGALNQVRLITPSSFPLPPGSLAALTTQPDTLARQYPTSSDRSRMVQVASMPSLPDDEGTVWILSPDSVTLDSLTYSDDQHMALLTNREGVSLERIRLNGPSSISNFQSAAANAGFATPGRPNSQSRPDAQVADNTISIDPRVITPDCGCPTSFATINYAVPGAGYTANLTIFDSQGRMMRRLARNQTLSLTGSFTWNGENDDNRRVPVGYYVLYAELFDLDGAVKVLKETVAVGIR